MLQGRFYHELRIRVDTEVPGENLLKVMPGPLSSLYALSGMDGSEDNMRGAKEDIDANPRLQCNPSSLYRRLTVNILSCASLFPIELGDPPCRLYQEPAGSLVEVPCPAGGAVSFIHFICCRVPRGCWVVVVVRLSSRMYDGSH